MTDDLEERLLDVASPLADEAAGTIHRLTAELAEDADVRTQIDHRLEELVGQVDALTAERDDRNAAYHGALNGWKDAYARAEKAEKELQEMQAHIDHADAYHKAMLAAEADNARLQGMVDKCQSIAKDAVSMCNEGIPVSAKNVAMAVLRAMTGNVTVGGGRVDWGDQPVAAPTGKADT
jgi:chromosome segregation ATPase